VTWPAPSHVTPYQEQVGWASDHEDKELAPIRVDFHRRSASASGLIAIAVHSISMKIEIWRSCCSTMAKV